MWSLSDIRKVPPEMLPPFSASAHVTTTAVGYTPATTWPSFSALPATSLPSIFDPIHFFSAPVITAARVSLTSAFCSALYSVLTMGALRTAGLVLSC